MITIQTYVRVPKGSTCEEGSKRCKFVRFNNRLKAYYCDVFDIQLIVSGTTLKKHFECRRKVDVMEMARGKSWK